MKIYTGITFLASKSVDVMRFFWTELLHNVPENSNKSSIDMFPILTHVSPAFV